MSLSMSLLMSLLMNLLMSLLISMYTGTASYLILILHSYLE